MQYSPKTEKVLTSTASNVLFYGGGLFAVSIFTSAVFAVFHGEFSVLFQFLVTGIVMGGLPMYIGWKGRKKAKQSQAQANIRKLESTLLNLAETSKGVLTRSTVALKLKISVDEAQEILNYATSKGIARVNFDDDGNVNYIFPDFIKK